MIPSEIAGLWQKYVEAEKVRVRQESLLALSCFTDALSQLSPDIWHPWACELAMRIVDENEDIPVRLPLFQFVIFPALRAGLEKSIPGSARRLAGFAQLLYKSPSCSEQLPENLRSRYGLLLRAVQDDPSDMRAKRSLLSLMRSRFDYALHELPAGVLYGQNGATIEQCDELMVELLQYESLAKEVGSESADIDLITEARFHIPTYRRYLSCREQYASYEQFLKA